MDETLAYGGSVTVNPNGGTAYLDSTYVDRQTVLRRDKNVTLYDAVRTGYKFYGWDKTYDRNGQPVFTAMWTKNGQAETYGVFYYDFDDAKSEYARFDANTLLVIDPNGGTARLDKTPFYDEAVVPDQPGLHALRCGTRWLYVLRLGSDKIR